MRTITSSAWMRSSVSTFPRRSLRAQRGNLVMATGPLSVTGSPRGCAPRDDKPGTREGFGLTRTRFAAEEQFAWMDGIGWRGTARSGVLALVGKSSEAGFAGFCDLTGFGRSPSPNDSNPGNPQILKILLLTVPRRKVGAPDAGGREGDSGSNRVND